MHRAWRCASLVAALALGSCAPFGEAAVTSVAGSSGDAGSDAGASGGCDLSSSDCIGRICTDGSCTLARSCKALHAARADLHDGVYVIDTDGAGEGAPTRLYCDMSTDGGGWTLVARSVAGLALASDFGWEDDHGDVDDDAEPLSVEVVPLGLAFTEILFGARGSGKAWEPGGPVYKHVVPEGFVATYAKTGFDSGDGPRTVLGTCRPSRGPTMLSIVGFTELGDHFAFTDSQGNATFGLFSDGWDTNGAFATPQNVCSYTGELTGKQGMIMVR